MGMTSGAWKALYDGHSIEVEYKTSGWTKLLSGAKNASIQGQGRLFIDGKLAEDLEWESGILSLRGMLELPTGPVPVVARLTSKYGVMPIVCIIEVAGQEQPVSDLSRTLGASKKRVPPPASQADSRICPHCSAQMRRDAETCQSCGGRSQPWALYQGRWWARDEDGNQYWLDDSTGKWIRREPVKVDRNRFSADSAPSPPRAPSVATAAASDGQEVLSQLRQLGELRDAGVVTPEEFDAKKAELLSRL